MIYKRKHIVVALGGNALGNTLPEQMIAVKSTAKAHRDLIEEGHQVVVVHGNGPQVGMINNAMTALTHEDQAQPNTPLSVCVAMSQAYMAMTFRTRSVKSFANVASCVHRLSPLSHRFV